MKNRSNHFMAIVGLSLLLSSCVKEEPANAVTIPEQELKAVPLLASCGDQTTGAAEVGFRVTAGSPKNLTKYRTPYAFALPVNLNTGVQYRKRDVVGMGTDGDANLHFVWYKDGRYSAGASDDLASVRKPHQHSYILPFNPLTPGVRYQPEDIVGMAIDGENNSVYAWYKNHYVSSGSPGNLGSKRAPYHYDLAVNPRNGKEFKPSQIRAIAMDGELNRTIVFYQYRFVSEGRTNDLDYFTAQNGGQAYCIDKLPAINIKPKNFIGAGIDYTNRYVFIWSKGPQS